MSFGTSIRQLWNGVSTGRRSRPTSARDASFSQEGEDRLVGRMLEVIGISPRRHRGFYVDVGAHHPTRFSNTYYWYLRGWRGINLDALPGSMEPFRKLRPRDVNIECGIAAAEGVLDFYAFEEPALNTFSSEVAQERIANPRCRLKQKIPVRTRPLASVLKEHLPPGQQIDLLTVDVEGLDLAVLQSNDWQAFRPLLILAESCDLGDLRKAVDSEINQFLTAAGYVLTSKLVHTLCFARRDMLP